MPEEFRLLLQLLQSQELPLNFLPELQHSGFKTPLLLCLLLGYPTQHFFALDLFLLPTLLLLRGGLHRLLFFGAQSLAFFLKCLAQPLLLLLQRLCQPLPLLLQRLCQPVLFDTQLLPLLLSFVDKPVQLDHRPILRIVIDMLEARKESPQLRLIEEKPLVLDQLQEHVRQDPEELILGERMPPILQRLAEFPREMLGDEDEAVALDIVAHQLLVGSAVIAVINDTGGDVAYLPVLRAQAQKEIHILKVHHEILVEFADVL